LFKSSHCKKCVPNCITAGLGIAQKNSSKLRQNYHREDVVFSMGVRTAVTFLNNIRATKNYTNFRRLGVPLLVIFTSVARERVRNNGCALFQKLWDIPGLQSCLKHFAIKIIRDRQTKTDS
jgi:hypothetical protein